MGWEAWIWTGVVTPGAMGGRSPSSRSGLVLTNASSSGSRPRQEALCNPASSHPAFSCQRRQAPRGSSPLVISLLSTFLLCGRSHPLLPGIFCEHPALRAPGPGEVCPVDSVSALTFLCSGLLGGEAGGLWCAPRLPQLARGRGNPH